jgi:hypothetical protein
MATRSAAPVRLSAATVAVAGAATFAALLATHGAWPPVIGVAGVALLVTGMATRREPLIAAGIGLLGLEAVIALAVPRSAPPAAALTGIGLLAIGECASLAVELHPRAALGDGALAGRARALAAVLIAGLAVSAVGLLVATARLGPAVGVAGALAAIGIAALLTVLAHQPAQQHDRFELGFRARHRASSAKMRRNESSP